MDPEFKPRDVAGGQNLETSVKCSYAAVMFLNAYISIVSRQKALIFRTCVCTCHLHSGACIVTYVL